MKSMEDMIKAAQAAAETIQKQMNDTQAKLDGLEVEGVSGGGLVKIRCSAKGRVIGVAINGGRFPDAEVAAERERVRQRMGLPVCDVLRHGPDELVDAVLELRRQKKSV